MTVRDDTAIRGPASAPWVGSGLLTSSESMATRSTAPRGTPDPIYDHVDGHAVSPTRFGAVKAARRSRRAAAALIRARSPVSRLPASRPAVISFAARFRPARFAPARLRDHEPERRADGTGGDERRNRILSRIDVHEETEDA